MSQLLLQLIANTTPLDRKQDYKDRLSHEDREQNIRDGTYIADKSFLQHLFQWMVFVII